MNSKIKSALLIGALLVTSSTQVYAWGDYDGGWGYDDSDWGDDDSDWTHTHDSKCGHKTYSVPEPSTLALMSLGLLGFVLTRRKK
jgi:hypothetical protein